METVNNLRTAASRAIWGDGTSTKTETVGTEPLSGETGNVEAGEPYGKGNIEPTPTATDSDSASKPTTNNSAPGSKPITMPIRSEHETSKTGVTSAHNPPSSFAPDNKPTSSNDTTAANPTSEAQDITKQQGADKPHKSPGSDESERIKETKKEAEEASKIDTSEPGPKSLEDKSRDGGVGSGVTGDKNQSMEDEIHQKSHGEGTGEKYIKSNGMKADGGNFDAANAGAGKEADRLLEQKGIHHEVPSKPEPASPGSPADTPTKKLSLGDKIKAKLHKHKD